MKKIIFSFIIFISLMLGIKTVRADDAIFVYVSGASLGIKLQTEVEVLGTYGVNTKDSVETPWDNLIEEHDVIVKANNSDIKTAQELISSVEKSKGSNMNLTIRRNNNIIEVNVKPVLNNKGKYSLGLFIKDYEMGVGTLSFVEQKTLRYASLGHQMITKSINGGDVYQASVKEIVLPRENTAGNKRAEVVGNTIGNVSLNVKNGVYGVMSSNNLIKNSTLMELTKASDVHTGAAYILTSIESTTIEAFDIEIVEAKKQEAGSIKGLKFKVTDDELIEKTGGIIQGMSGSPIIQDGKLIGAVTHVVLKDAKCGYGCYAEYMYDTLQTIQ